MTEESPADRYRRFKKQFKREREDWRWSSYTQLVWALVLTPTAFLIGVVIGFFIPL